MPDTGVEALVAEAAKLLHQGRRTRALDHLDAAKKLAPNDGQVLGLRGVTLARMGRADEARADLLRAAELRPDDARAWANLATFLIETGDSEEAKRAAEKALTLDSTDEGALAVMEQIGRGGSDSTRMHMVAFIVGRERIWDWFGKSLLGLSIITTLLLVIIPPIAVPGAGFEGLAKSMPKQNLFAAFEIFLWMFVSISCLFWLTIDMVDRRSRLVWAVPQTICGLCGVAWFPLSVYFWIGRD